MEMLSLHRSYYMDKTLACNRFLSHLIVALCNNVIPYSAMSLTSEPTKSTVGSQSTHGPIRYQLDKSHYDQLPSEHPEASEKTFETDLFSAITFCAQLAFAIRDKKYDEQFEQVVKALVYFDGGEKVVRAITAAKDCL